MKRIKGICGGVLCLALLLGCLGGLGRLGAAGENSKDNMAEEMIGSGSGAESAKTSALITAGTGNGESASEKSAGSEKGTDSMTAAYNNNKDIGTEGGTATDSGSAVADTGSGSGVLRAEAGLAPPSTSAACAVLVDGTGDTLFAKDAERKAYPASTTKIMTALVVLETLDELGLGIGSEIIVPQEAVGIEGSSIYLKKGERLSIEELLYGLMLQSGNDSAVALAICVGGSLSDFVVKMNEKAAALGCTGTHFTNPNGLYDENHYTTAADLAKIALAAMQREDFRKIVSAKTWQNEESGRSFYNKNKTVHQYSGATGVKIGFTKASGRTLVASAERNGEKMIAVVLQDGNWFQDAYALMDYGFTLKEGKTAETAAE